MSDGDYARYQQEQVLSLSQAYVEALRNQEHALELDTWPMLPGSVFYLPKGSV